MSRPRILDEAAEELEAAAAYLEAERPGYARVFPEAYEENVPYSRPERSRGLGSYRSDSTSGSSGHAPTKTYPSSVTR